MHAEIPQAANLVTHEVSGKLGIMYNPDNGIVTEVKEESPAKALGVQARGLPIICNSPFTG